MPLKLIVGNKNYSSWSLRPWIAMKAAGIPFEEQVISLDAPDFKAAAPAARALARAVANEMHAGFQPLRKLMPMNQARAVIKRALTPEAAANARRIEALWADCRARYGGKNGGPFLFGKFGAADAMYAPVVARFHTYAVEVSAPSRAYMDAVMALPAWREWHAAALQETWVLPEDEVDWPAVHRA